MRNLNEKPPARRCGGVRVGETNRVPAMFVRETELRGKYEPRRDGTARSSGARCSPALLLPSPSAGKYDSELYYARRSPSSVVELSRESGRCSDDGDAAASASAREPISMVMNCRPIAKDILNMYMHGARGKGSLRPARRLCRGDGGVPIN